jgi:hypothetical protein
MDFFDRAMLQEEEMDTGLLPIPEQDGPERIPQVDGTYDSPRKPRKRKSSYTPVPGTNTKRVRESQGSRDYRPSSRRSNGSDLRDEEAQPRRTSRRVAQRATILSDPVENLDYFEKALSQSPVKKSNGRVRAKLEVQDSTGSDENLDSLQGQPEHAPLAQYPVTPTKGSFVVLSSQSPDPVSLTKQKAISSEVDLRSPLRQRSVNLPTAPSATPASSGGTHTGLGTEDGAKLSAKKLSRRRMSKSKIRVDDSQANVWSVPDTSSPPKQQASQSLTVSDSTRGPLITLGTIVEAGSSKDSLEIPATSQAGGPVDRSPALQTQHTLPSPSDLTSMPPPIALPSEQSATYQVEVDKPHSEVIVRDFAEVQVPTQMASLDAKASPLEVTPDTIDRPVDEVGDSDSDFGSPIANDTQFNFELEHRTSSPTRSQTRTSTSDHDPHDTQRLSDALRGQEDNECKTDSVDRIATSPVPTPRLIHRLSTAAKLDEAPQAESSSEEFLLPPLPHHNVSTTQVSTTRVPLNDVQLSSSPALPSNKSITQRLVHPASMPHPSQISTQEDTQGYFGQSSLILGEQDTETPRGKSHITIKDSSSVRLSMSQIPAHGPTGSQNNVDLGLDELDTGEDDDYDLDPPSSDPGPPRHGALRKPNFPTKANGQTSLINTLRDNASPARDDLDPSPSPSSSRVESQKHEPVHAADPPSSPSQIQLYSPLREQHSQIPGFNNETQSNFTQNGHVTAAYIHRQREKGVYPTWYTPKPYQLEAYRIPGYTRR